MEDVGKHVYDWLDVTTKNERANSVDRRMAGITIAEMSNLRATIARLERENEELQGCLDANDSEVTQIEDERDELKATIARLEAELERVTGDRDGLREVVEKYPLTADGKRAYPRMPMWGWVDRHDGSPGRVHRMNWGMDRPEEIEKCYSSEELANEAAAALSARQNNDAASVAGKVE